MEPLIAVTTTVDDAEAARRMARAVVEGRLAACAQVAEVQSHYMWQGALQEAREFRIVFKSTQSRWEALRRALRSLHPYELPEIHAEALTQADPAYAQWVRDACAPDMPAHDA